MDATWKYAGVTSLFVASASVAGAVGLALANYAFAQEACALRSNGKFEASVAQPDQVAKAKKQDITSPLVGATVAETKSAVGDAGRSEEEPSAEEEWVEVVDAVNMRSGASSANSVIKVQLQGKRLRVASRDGGWVKVVEPKTGEEGWVYGKYVKRPKPTTRRADLTDGEAD